MFSFHKNPLAEVDNENLENTISVFNDDKRATPEQIDYLVNYLNNNIHYFAQECSFNPPLTPMIVEKK